MSRPEDEALIERILADRLTFLSRENLENIARICHQIEAADLPGIFVEAGCALGGSSILIASTKATERPLFLYDVFDMIPPPTAEDPAEVHERYETIVNGESVGIGGDRYYGYRRNLLRVVKANLKKYSIKPRKRSVQFVKGLVQETMIIDRPVAFAHVDVDWYDPVKTCLQRIFPFLVPGGSIILDDYFFWGGCRKATDDYLRTVPGQYGRDESAGVLRITRL